MPRILAVMAIVACAMLPASSNGSTASVTVSMDVPSSVSLTNQCIAEPAWNLGTVLPGATATTATGASVCRFDFGSSNDSAMLRLRQADGTGGAAGKRSPTWSTQVPQGDDVRALARGLSATHFWASHWSGDIRRSTDSGQTWATVDVGGTAYISLAAANDSVLYGGSWWGNLHTSADAGATWTAIDPAVHGVPAAAHVEALTTVPGTNLVWLGASNGLIRHSSDAGVSWSTQGAAASPTWISEMQATDATTVWAVEGGWGGRPLRTTNGGVAGVGDWAAAGPGFGFSPQGMHAADANRAWVVGDSGQVAFTANGGGTWVERHPFGSYELALWDVWAADASTVYVVGDRGAVARSLNGGDTWTVLTPPAGQPWQVVTGSSATNVVVGGAGNTLMHTGNGGDAWTVPLHEVATLYAVSGIDASRAWAVGSRGTIRATSDGTTWSDRVSGTSRNLWDVEVLPSSVGWAVGDAGTTLRTTNGTSWAGQPSGAPTTRLNAVAAATGLVAWSVGENGTIRATRNGGARWTSQASGTTEHLFDIDALSDGQTAWASGNNGVLRRTTDGGVTWTSISSPVGWAAWRSIRVVDANTAWISGRWDQVWVTSDAGATWSRRQGTGWALGLDAVGPRDAMVAQSAKVAITADRGAAWTEEGDGRAYGIDAVDTNTIWTVGFSGRIQKSQPAQPIADHDDTVTDWDQGPATFGVCLQDLALGASVAAGWTEDLSVTPGRCDADDSDPWRAIPATSSTIATTTGAGQTGRVDLVWGFRAASNQPKGDYRATVLVEAIAPSA